MAGDSVRELRALLLGRPPHQRRDAPEPALLIDLAAVLPAPLVSKAVEIALDVRATNPALGDRILAALAPRLTATQRSRLLGDARLPAASGSGRVSGAPGATTRRLLARARTADPRALRTLLNEVVAAIRRRFRAPRGKAATGPGTRKKMNGARRARAARPEPRQRRLRGVKKNGGRRPVKKARGRAAPKPTRAAPPPPGGGRGPRALPEGRPAAGNGGESPTANGRGARRVVRPSPRAMEAAAGGPSFEVTVAEEEAPRARTVNTGFASLDQADKILPATTPLRAGGQYYFAVEVGEPLPEAAQAGELPLPPEVPPEARLQVVLFPFRDEIEVTPGKRIGELQVQADGRVVVSRTVAEPAGVGQDRLRMRLFFPVKAPDREGVFRLSCSFFYEKILIHSYVVQILVMNEPKETAGALRPPLVEYTLSQSLSAAHLGQMRPHKASVALRDNGDGTHTFRFVGAGEFPPTQSRIEEGKLKTAVQQARGALRRVAWGNADPWKENGPTYRYEQDRKPQDFARDIIDCAIKGRRLYHELSTKLTWDLPDEVDKVALLRKLMREPGLVQIALEQSAGHVLPAAMLYDHPLDTTSTNFSLCPAFLKSLDEKPDLEETACFMGRCPSWGQRTVVCPSGFWGFRHMVGMPLSVPLAPEAPPLIFWEGAQAPRLLMAVWAGEDFRERVGHQTALKQLVRADRWHLADDRDKALTLLREANPHVVYFYCHGGMTPDGTPFLQIGASKTGGFLTADVLAEFEVVWKEPRPLVFINGCRTTELDPEQILDFVEAGFIGTSHAAGVIGTEITIFEPLARAFAEECLDHFFNKGEMIGEAVRRARLALLKRRNPLGLVYVPFALASLRLVEQSNA